MQDEQLDKRQLKALLIEQLPRLRRFAFSLTGNRADADDLIQSLAEKILKQGIKTDVEPVPWLIRVCKNLWIDELRARESRDRMHRTSAEQPDVAQFSEIPDDKLKPVYQAMGRLSLDHRQLVSLVIIEGFSYVEAGKILDIPTGTVMSRLARARARLTELIKA